MNGCENMINELKIEIKKALEAFFKQNYDLEINIVVEEPKKAEMGDISIPSFSVVKALRRPLPECANIIKDEVVKFDYVLDANVMGGFVNLTINKSYVSSCILKQILDEKENYAGSEKNGKNIVIDYSSPNIAKPFSIGHLRSTIIGHSLKLIYLKAGYNVIGINHLGDWGSQFGKVIVAYKKWGSEESVKEDSLSELAKLYVRFHQEAKEDPSLDDEAREVFMKLEQGNEEYLKLWQWFRAESVKEAMNLYEMLDVSFDSYNGEAFFNDKMDGVVKELEEKNLLVLDDGASIVKLDDDMPPALIKRRDGASLYITRDLAAVFYRKKTYSFNKCLYVVGNEQKLHFNQLKKVIEKMGYDYGEQIYHINFGFVLRNGKKMSTRDGGVTTLKDVLNEAIKAAYNQINIKNPSLEDKENIAKNIGVGAVIFNDLKNHRSLDYEFNIDQMLKFEGQTGPYIQYTGVRINSILRENKIDEKINYDVFLKQHYFDVVKLLDQFKDMINRAINENAPSVICKYLLSIAQEFNVFYAKEKILTDDLETRNANLLLITAVKIVLEEGLRLVGIKSLERM